MTTMDIILNSGASAELIKINASFIKFVSKQTDELCKLAVQKNVSSLQFVKEQTEELCKFAILQNIYAL